MPHPSRFPSRMSLRTRRGNSAVHASDESNESMFSIVFPICVRLRTIIHEYDHLSSLVVDTANGTIGLWKAKLLCSAGDVFGAPRRCF